MLAAHHSSGVAVPRQRDVVGRLDALAGVRARGSRNDQPSPAAANMMPKFVVCSRRVLAQIDVVMPAGAPDLVTRLGGGLGARHGCITEIRELLVPTLPTVGASDAHEAAASGQ